MITRTIETSDNGIALLTEFKETVRMLAGISIEAFGTNQQILLSPVLREMILAKAKRLEELRLQIDNYLCVDYLH